MTPPRRTHGHRPTQILRPRAGLPAPGETYLADRTTAADGSHAIEAYHHQDDTTKCGAACIQMLLGSRGLPFEGQDRLQADATAPANDLGESWSPGMNPAGLASAVARRVGDGRPPLEVWRYESGRALAHRIAWTIYRWGTPVAVLVGGFEHWLVVHGAQIAPAGATEGRFRVDVLQFLDPFPPLASSRTTHDTAPPPPHEPSDRCTTMIDGAAVEALPSLDFWLAHYTPPVPVGDPPAGSPLWGGRIVAVGPREIAGAVPGWMSPTVPADPLPAMPPPGPGHLPDPVLVTTRLSGWLSGLPLWRQTLLAPGRRIVEELLPLPGRSGGPCYLVLFAPDPPERSAVLTLVGHEHGELLFAGRYETLGGRFTKNLLAASLADLDLGAPYAFGAGATLSHDVCWSRVPEAPEPTLPFRIVERGGHPIAFVRMDGRVFDPLAPIAHVRGH